MKYSFNKKTRVSDRARGGGIEGEMVKDHTFPLFLNPSLSSGGEAKLKPNSLTRGTDWS